MATLLPTAVLHHLSVANQANLLGKSFFPNLISSPFMVGLHGVFYLSVVMCVIAAIASLLRGQRYIHDQIAGTNEASSQESSAAKVEARS